MVGTVAWNELGCQAVHYRIEEASGGTKICSANRDVIYDLHTKQALPPPKCSIRSQVYVSTSRSVLHLSAAA